MTSQMDVDTALAELAARAFTAGSEGLTPPPVVSPIDRLTDKMEAFRLIQDGRFERLMREQTAARNELKAIARALAIPANPVVPATLGTVPRFPLSEGPDEGEGSSLSMLPMALTPLPARFGGEPQEYQQFRLKCQLHFDARPAHLDTDAKKVRFIVLLLEGNAFKWVAPILRREDPILKNLDLFTQQMDMVFERQYHLQARRQEFLYLTQGVRSVLAYLTEFQTLAAEELWPETCQVGLFHKGLKEELKDALMMVDPLPEDMNSYIRLVLRLEHRLAERGSRHGVQTVVCPTPTKVESQVSPVVEEPMEVGAVRSTVSSKERNRRQKGRRCFYCGQFGHFIGQCPTRPPSGNAPATHEGGK